MSSLKVVALISGGKDSFYSILHCLANGHEVVALANLHPVVSNGESAEDIDSFMYQTVGHAVIPLYEAALGLPLYRQEITGRAINQDKTYGPTAPVSQEDNHDEVESLSTLLSKVLHAHPDINAVSTGAILSDYQRTRVESVALRLGLIPLSYLWQYPFLPPYKEASLLDDMRTVGQDARIIKVASGGLDERLLWANVAQPSTQQRLTKAMSRFATEGGGAVLGEGGEYETLAIDGPYPLWKGRIHVEDVDMSVTTGEAGSFSLALKNVSVVPKEPSLAPEASSDYPALRKPNHLDELFQSVRDGLRDQAESGELSAFSLSRAKGPNVTLRSHQHDLETLTWRTKRVGQYMTIVNAMSPGKDADEQMRATMLRLTHEMAVNPAAIISSTILLRSMSDFAAINAIYGSCFTTPSPPARVTISCGGLLPQGIVCSLSITIMDSQSVIPKRGLHVQSRSYWAPANIGPYSQAISVPFEMPAVGDGSVALTYVAGQIPLEPSTMEIASGQTHVSSMLDQSVLSLQHLWRIGQIMDVDLWLGSIAYLACIPEGEDNGSITVAVNTWKLAHQAERPVEDDNEGDIDVWDIMNKQTVGIPEPQKTARKLMTQLDFLPPCFAVEVDALPRNALIEWASQGVSAGSGAYRLRDLSSRDGVKDHHQHHHQEIVLDTSPMSSEGAVVPLAGWLWFGTSSDMDSIDSLRDVIPLSSTAVTVYTTVAFSYPFGEVFNAQLVFCRRIWDAECRPVTTLIAYRAG